MTRSSDDRLTDAYCQSATCPPGKPRIRLADSLGLYLEVAANGARYWRFKYRIDGKEKRISVGVYPDVTLATARQCRDAAREQLKNGIDPSARRKSEKIAAAQRRAEAAATVQVSELDYLRARVAQLEAELKRHQTRMAGMIDHDRGGLRDALAESRVGGDGRRSARAAGAA